MLTGLHIVGWPLLLGILGERSGFLTRPLPPRVAAWMARADYAVLFASLIAIATYVAVAFQRPALTEWVERGVLAIARYWVRGGNVYPDPQTLKQFGVFPYGPLLFQCVGAVFAATGAASKTGVKLFPIILALAGYAAMFALLRRQGVALRHSALSVALLAVVVGIMAFMVKADIMLIVLAILACWLGHVRDRQILAGIGLAVLAGLAVAIKIHGVFYILPAAIECLAARPQGLAWKLCVGGAIAAGVAMAPFLLPETSLSNYIYILRSASQDGLLFGIFLSNMAFISICVAGVHVITPVPARDAAYRRLIASVLAAGLFVSVFAAKSEAGPHHLIPLLPYLCLPLARALGPPRVVLFALFLVSFQPITSVVHDITLMLEHWNSVFAVI